MGDKIRFTCECGKKLVAPAAAAGKTARCIACQRVVKIPDPTSSELVEDTELGFAPTNDFPPVANSPRVPSAASSPPRANPLSPITPPPPLPPGMPPLPGSRSPLSPLVPPPIPSRMPAGNIQSILDEESARNVVAAPTTPCPHCGSPMPSHAVVCLACGFSIRSGKVSGVAPTTDAEKKPTSPLSWLSRTWTHGTNNGSNRSLRFTFILIGVGVVVFLLGLKEWRLASASTEVPETISLQKLIDRGPDGNANIVLTNFQLCMHFVKGFKTIGGVKADDVWTKVWVPVVPRTGGIGGLFRATDPDNFKAIIYSEHVKNEPEMAQVLNVPQLHGLVVNRIASLETKEREILLQHYHGVDFDRCLIIEEGRAPKSSALIFLFLGGGALMVVAGGLLLARRFLFK